MSVSHSIRITRPVHEDSTVPLTPEQLDYLAGLPAAQVVPQFRKLLEHVRWLGRRRLTSGQDDMQARWQFSAGGTPEQVLGNLATERNHAPRRMDPPAVNQLCAVVALVENLLDGAHATDSVSLTMAGESNGHSQVTLVLTVVPRPAKAAAGAPALNDAGMSKLTGA